VHLPARLRALLDIAGLVLLTAFFALITWYGFGVFQTSYRLGAQSLSPLGTPLMVPQLIWVLGFVMFLAIAVLLLIRALVALVGGDLATVRRLVGSRTLREEVAAEVAAEVREARDPAAGPRA
jgi:TRAP-type mannitol/chloroaromatic compound transport system permease small subunit